MVEKLKYDKFLILKTKGWQKANYFNFKTMTTAGINCAKYIRHIPFP